MNKNSINPLPEFFGKYILLVPENDLLLALQSSINTLKNLDWELLDKIGDKVYAPEKWTLKDIFQHLLDNDRVQTYRALRIARGDSNARPGYDEQVFAQHGFTKSRPLEKIVEELLLHRKSTLLFFESLPLEITQQTALVSGISMSILGLGFQIVGHQIHHFNILKERYFPLA